MHKPSCLWTLCALVVLALSGCCSAPTHEAFVTRANAGIGKTYVEIFPDYKNTREQDIKRYETTFDKIKYRDLVVYAPKGISFDGVEGLSDVSNWCITRDLIAADSLRVVDWKYVKGSNPKKCIARLTPCEGGTGW